MKTLSIITTTYNRAYCLRRLYDSLLRQDSDDFLWLVIDDGSSDGTRELINEFILENKIEIRYHYQENKGMTGARNTGYRLCDTELNTIIDSDDWLSDGAVSAIIDFWNKNKKENIAGIIGLDVDINGNVIGDGLPCEKEITTYELTSKYKSKGDKKFIYRSELSRQYPYPEFEGEKFYPASYKFHKIDLTHKMLVLNRPVCVVNYNEDSMTFHKFAQYKSCAKGFAHYRNEEVSMHSDFIINLKHTIHYVAESKFAGEKHYIRKFCKKGYFIFALPIGLLYHLYLLRTNKKY